MKPRRAALEASCQTALKPSEDLITFGPSVARTLLLRSICHPGYKILVQAPAALAGKLPPLLRLAFRRHTVIHFCVNSITTAKLLLTVGKAAVDIGYRQGSCEQEHRGINFAAASLKEWRRPLKTAVHQAEEAALTRTPSCLAVQSENLEAN